MAEVLSGIFDITYCCGHVQKSTVYGKTQQEFDENKAMISSWRCSVCEDEHAKALKKEKHNRITEALKKAWLNPTDEEYPECWELYQKIIAYYGLAAEVPAAEILRIKIMNSIWGIEAPTEEEEDCKQWVLDYLNKQYNARWWLDHNTTFDECSRIIMQKLY